MKRRLILHIGSPKCGSTFLQQTLRQNGALLSEAGISYPCTPEGHPGNAADLRYIAKSFVREGYGDSHHTLILSHEDLLYSSNGGEKLSRIVEHMDLDLTVLAFLRPFPGFLYADYSQFMKQNFEAWLAEGRAYEGLSFEEFAADRARAMHPALALSHWLDYYNAPRLILRSHLEVRPTLQKLLGPDLPPLDWEVPPVRRNRSLPTSECEALARAIADPDRDPEALRARFHAAYGLDPRTDPGRTPDRDRWIEAMYYRENRAIFDRYGYDNRLDPTRPWH